MIKIAIIMGGNSAERTVSIKSANTIYDNIDTLYYDAYKVEHVENNIFNVKLKHEKIKVDIADFSFKYQNEKINFDLAFIMIHGDPGENGELCSYFEKINIPYNSCNKSVSQLTFNKKLCNQTLEKIGYNVPKVFNSQTLDNIVYPCIIKPVDAGSSLGISKVSKKSEIEKAIDLAKQHSNNIIFEEFIEGRELTCAVFNFPHNKQSIYSLPITEIISENDIFDYDAKYNGKSKEITPADIPINITKNIKDISEEIYQKLDLKGIIRIDFILNNDTPYIIEINTIPGFSEESIVPQMLRSANIKLMSFLSWQIQSILD